MTRGACTFRSNDVKRAVKAAQAAGVTVTRIEVEPSGKLTIVVDKPGEACRTNEWDEVLDRGKRAS
jgi:hypothetical protein